jgi:AcrR family transcriptional regulator
VHAFDIIRHFQSSENILRACLERELELMAAATQAPELRMPGETLADELRVLAGVILDQYRRRLPFLGKLLSESMRDSKVGTLFYSTFIVQGRLLFTEFLRIRKQFGELREDIDIEAAAATFLASLTGILLMHELFGGKHVESLDDDRVLRQMCDTFLHGTVTR